VGHSSVEISMGNEELADIECGGMGTKGVRVVKGDGEISTGHEQEAR
jgi:hypothetical protein